MKAIPFSLVIFRLLLAPVMLGWVRKSGCAHNWLSKLWGILLTITFSFLWWVRSHAAFLYNIVIAAKV